MIGRRALNMTQLWLQHLLKAVYTHVAALAMPAHVSMVSKPGVQPPCTARTCSCPPKSCVSLFSSTIAESQRQ